MKKIEYQLWRKINSLICSYEQNDESLPVDIYKLLELLCKLINGSLNICFVIFEASSVEGCLDFRWDKENSCLNYSICIPDDFSLRKQKLSIYHEIVHMFVLEIEEELKIPLKERIPADSEELEEICENIAKHLLKKISLSLPLKRAFI